MASNLENEVDFISNMPDPILEMILQRLPTTEVVRTSVLSTRWSLLLMYHLYDLARRSLRIHAARDRKGKFPESFPNIKTLNLTTIDAFSMSVTICIDAANDPQGDFPASFPNLKTLELTTTIDAFTMKVLIHILRCSPNLECLRLIIEKELLTSEHWDLDEVEARGVMTRHLKRVEFLEFNGEQHKLGIARLLLEHGYELKEMLFSWCNEVSYHEKSVATMNELSEFHKASSTVKLIALLKD
ncbi:F-box domain, FBD domain, Leucine-rich repeat domain, L domain-like protein [Artemisia annua]|uniref:F-box domain, FBD domain, Leucine-rich repeat domain, L domain-like protein n=1 Tax=Artemisia annua TaxID=35608 RepID=A0A2U1LPA9_ARTAN|nr:F-box domain, FBD domain, Leucine-rich repeat domain, L domain-like protein [Artemisia annua]